MRSITISGSRFDPASFSGAPLDVIKVVAALLMIGDHVNAVFLGNHPTLWWHLGRIVFPLFAFALVCNLQRGSNVAKYLTMLLLLGALSQPVFAGTLGATEGNTLFTLAVGIAAAAMLRDQSLPVQHTVLGAGALAIFLPYVKARTGLDFGLAGMLFPATLYLVVNGATSHAVWLILLLIGLNWFQPDPWQFAPLTTAAVAAAGAGAVLLFALAFKGRQRFLPRYALHVFYPGHLLVLGVLHALWLASK